MSYAEVDPQILSWRKRHALSLYTSWAGGEVRGIYVSSVAGECFQIWIEAPAKGHVRVYAAGVDSRRDNDPAKTWSVSVANLGQALEEAFQTVIGWMVPSRYLPDQYKAIY
jgi:hypothetical protein